MITSELRRLSLDLTRDAALRARLAAALAPGAEPLQAAALLQRAGYRIGPEHLRQTEVACDDDLGETAPPGALALRHGPAAARQATAPD
jgi:hypothetical protein